MRAFAAAILVSSCLSVVPASAMTMSFDWGATTKCFDGNSPPIHVEAVPKGTKKLKFVMRDLDAPGFNHGGGIVSYTGDGALAYGAFHYKGPCPPSVHTYRMTVTALDGRGKAIARASAERKFPLR